MASLDRTWALNQLRHKRNSYIAALAAMHFLNTDMVRELGRTRVLLHQSGITFNPYPGEKVGRNYEIRLRQIISNYVYRKSDHEITVG